MRHVFKIDFDDRIDKWGWLDAWRRSVIAICREFGMSVTSIRVVPSPSGSGLHAWVHVECPKKLSDEEINMFQFLLGDDRTRVRINRVRIKRGVRHWNILFSGVLWKREDEKCKECKLRKYVEEVLKECG